MTRLINGMTFKTQFQGKLLITKKYIRYICCMNKKGIKKIGIYVAK